MTIATSVVGPRTAQVPNRLAPMRFVIAFGASAALVGFVTGAGEAVALAAFISVAGGCRVASTRETEADRP